MIREKAMLGVAALFAIVLGSGIAIFFATSFAWAGTAWPWLAVATPLLIACIAAGSVRRIREELFERFRGRGLDISKGFVLAAALYAVTLVGARALCASASPRSAWLVSVYGQLGDPRVLAAHSFAVPCVILAIAFLEEVVWRGLVVILLEERVGSRSAWAVSALLYAAAQVPSAWSLGMGGLNPLLILAALLLGLVLGAVAWRTGRLGLGVFAHALYVWAICVSFPLWTLKGVA